MARRPDFIIGGASKSGTTSMTDGSMPIRRSASIEEGAPVLRRSDGAPRMGLVPQPEVLTLLTDDMRLRPHDAFCEVCQFLQVQPIVNERVGSTVNASTAFRSLRVQRAAKRLPRLPARVVERLDAKVLQHPPMDSATGQRLRADFAPHNQALGDALGRHIPWARGEGGEPS